ncbi:MAG: DUF1294 domain-containing protein [Planctomycetota bacterium]
MSWTVIGIGYVAWVVVLSVATFITFAWDKRRALKNGWRVRERTLHTLELLGGWPGALLGMRWLRHKSIKKSYRLVFGVMVALHITAITAAVVIGLRSTS